MLRRAPLREVCREAGGRVATNVLIRDLDLDEFNAFDNRLVEVIADGLTLWQGDTTLCPLCEEMALPDQSGKPQQGSFGGSQAQEGNDLPRTRPRRRR